MVYTKWCIQNECKNMTKDQMIHKTSEITTTFQEFQTLTDYSQSLLKEHCKTYQCKQWQLRINAERTWDTFY